MSDYDNVYLGPPSGQFRHLNNSTNQKVDDIDHFDNLDVDNFDNWLQSYMSTFNGVGHVSYGDNGQPLESFEQIRDIFMQEFTLLKKLYEAVKKHSEEVLSRDRLNSGSKMYEQWGRTSRKEFLLNMYENEFFRAQYAKRRFLNSACSFLQAIGLRILHECPSIEEYLPQIHRVVSIGVGPGSDIASLIAFLRTRGHNQRLVYYAIDQCSHWGKYIATCDKAWSTDYNVSIWFKQMHFGRHLDCMDQLPDADLLVFSFSNTSLMSPDIWPILMKRYKLLIVLDGRKEVLTSNFLDNNFKKFQLNSRTNVYYSFNESNDDDDDDANQL